jgi:hypothetical protein
MYKFYYRYNKKAEGFNRYYYAFKYLNLFTTNTMAKERDTIQDFMNSQ